ncbi:PHD finger protein 14 isoform X4 [Bombus vancouverensis nearcticus]|uniref:PHD finger protein 14 isoform X4 n=1 Tax=Bombus bifarius TaxID=103933 RepID=A0A6P8LE95_9HYME|nr:PHD finger protein 14 isoform X4 [Bombus vancouverensis nearcticus]XP_033298506.1 PHD finger protein 14 isoform X4 [Bombus bifarius]
MSQEDDVGFLYKTMIERDPKKRRVKPVGSAQSLLDFDLGESSDDSDFRIEDHCEESDDDSVDSNDIGKEEEDVSEQSDDSLEDPLLKKKENPNLTVGDVIEQARQQALKGGSLEDKLNKMLICCGCLGDRSDDVNEIVECDGCGVSVHEGCYGVSDVESFSSTDSLCQSAPWFCEACSAGIEDPSCELCPNKGGIFKETDVGKWVHLVCALYVPGVAFGEVDRLSSVTLFEMAYSKWGAKQCSLCEDARFARTGVCIECDAGMCHTYFHVTCAQREGLLSEAHSEEVDQADPFYAHCKLHSDKTLVRRRRRNWLALQLRAQYRQQLLKQPNHLDTEEQRRIQRKLAKHRHKYLAHKASRPPPWVPTQKMPRLLTTSASACRQLARKAELMGVDTAALEAQEAQLVALVDVRKKWHIPPAFSVEFIGYYLDRNLRVTSMKRRLQELLDINSQLLNEQQRLDRRYDEVMKDNEEQIRINVTIKEKIEMYHQVLQSSGYVKPLPQITDLAKPRIAPTLGTGLGVPTAAALKMGVGFPLPVGKGTEGVREGRVLSSQAQDQNHKGELTLRHQCGICRRSTNQHLLAKCDTCHLHYHLSCLSPPLSRMPKKTKLMGWQCSECDKESSGSEVERVDTSAPRKLRHCKDDLNLTSTPTPLQEVQLPTTPTTPSTSKNSSDNLNSITNATTPDTPTTPKVTIKPVGPQPPSSTPIQSSEPIYNQQPINNVTITREGSPEYMVASADGTESVSQRSAKKRRRYVKYVYLHINMNHNIFSNFIREKHKRYTPDPITGIKQRKRKHKRKSLDVENPEGQSQPEIHRRITIKIKPIPRPEGDVASESSPQMFVATSTSTEITSPPPLPKLPPPPPVPPLPSNTVPVTANVSTNNTNSRTSTGNGKRGKDTDLLTHCNVCDMSGTSQNLVMCDECKKCYHFTCLDPPVKKSPKRRGYSWHCADCDPSASESET